MTTGSFFSQRFSVAAPTPNVDRLEGYPRLYDRILIQATFTDGSTDTGWVYIMNKLPASAKVIYSGDWKKRENVE